MTLYIILGIFFIWIALLTIKFLRKKPEEGSVDLTQYLKKAEIEKLLEQYYDKTGIDALLQNFDLTQYLKKAEIEKLLEQYYDKTEIDTLLQSFDLTQYLKKAEIEKLLEQYYDKTEIENLFEQYYDKTEIDTLIRNIDHSIPKGTIVMWAGFKNTIPSGWALCDGSNETPDLRGKFVYGIDSEEEPGGTGGNNDLTLNVDNLPLHAHGPGNLVTNYTGNHSHIFIYNAGTNGANTVPQGQYWMAGISFTGQTGNNHQTSVGGEHRHSVVSGTTEATGNGQPFDNRPAYFKLAFIMKL
jgi:microcystin-dependent protein